MIHHLFDIYFLSCFVQIVNLERSPQSSTNNRTNFCEIYLDRFASSQEATRQYLNMSLDHLGTGVTWWAKTEKPRNEKRNKKTFGEWELGELFIEILLFGGVVAFVCFFFLLVTCIYNEIKVSMNDFLSLSLFFHGHIVWCLPADADGISVPLSPDKFWLLVWFPEDFRETNQCVYLDILIYTYI